MSDQLSDRDKFFEGIPQKPPKNNTEVKMTWGKYKNKLVKDIIKFDEQYASWMYKQDYMRKFKDIYAILDKHFSSTE